MSISSPPNYGSPDWQRGYYNPQKLLATVPANTTSVRVTVPPNAESLIVTAADIADNGTVYVEGVSTLYKYPGVKLSPQPHMTAAFTWVFDISQTMDSQADVVFAVAPGQIWFVYADAGVHIIGDASALKDTLGQAYVVPTVPSVLARDHPLNELQVASGGFTANGVAIAAPGAGQRLRIFQTLIGPYIGNPTCYLQDNLGGKFLGLGGPSAPGGMSFYPSGYAMAGNSALDVVINGTTEGVYVVSYTVETI